MSKSKGNVIYPETLIDKYGLDATKYFLLRVLNNGQDGVFTPEGFVEMYNTELCNDLGNLLNRTIGMINKYFDGIVIDKKINEDIDTELINFVLSLKDRIEDNMDKLEISVALDSIFEVYRRCNKYIDETMPWVLAKDESKKDRLATVLYNLIESIRIATVYLQAFLPDTAKKIFTQINTDKINYDSISTFGLYSSGTKVNTPEVLFKRIEKE